MPVMAPHPLDTLTDSYSTVASPSCPEEPPRLETDPTPPVDPITVPDPDDGAATEENPPSTTAVAVHASSDSTEPVCGEDWSDARIAARVEVKYTSEKGRCMFSRVDGDLMHPGDIVFAESPLQIVTPDTCSVLYEWLKLEEADLALELPIVWHMAALSSLLFLNEDKLARCYDKWTPPIDAPTNESQGQPSSNYPNCQEMLHRLVYNHIEAIPRCDREPWMWKLTKLDARDYVHLLLTWRFNSFGHHTVADGLIMYDKISMLSHSCEATCCWHYGPEDSFVLRARVPIQPGDELTISYIGDEELFKSTNVRRQRLQGWLFTCHCHRCDEPVDYARGLRCIQCHAGVVCPYTEWKSAQRQGRHRWCTSPCTFCRTQLDESDMEEMETLEQQYEERLAVTDPNDEADIQLVYGEGMKVFSRGCHWILHQMDVWLATLCKDGSDWLGASAHQTDKAEYLSRVTPLANYAYAWCFEEIADTYLNLIAASTSSSLITKAVCNQLLTLYERSFYMLTILCGSDHTFTQSALSKWSNVRNIMLSIDSELSPTTTTEVAAESGTDTMVGRQLSDDIDIADDDGVVGACSPLTPSDHQQATTGMPEQQSDHHPI